MTPAWQSALETSLALGALASAAASIALARRSGSCRLRGEELSRRVDELSLRLRAIESRGDPSKPPSGGTGGLPTGASRGRPSLEANGGQATGATRTGPRNRIDPPQPTATATPLIAVPNLAMEGSGELAGEAAAELGRRFGSVWALADAGESPRAIARATGHPVGQVELILGLRPAEGRGPEGRPAVPRA